MKLAEIKGKTARTLFKVLITSDVIPCDIIVLDNTESYKIHITAEGLNTFALQMGLSLESYTKTLFQILSGELATSLISIENNTIIFNRTKQIKFYSAEAKKVNYTETLKKINDFLYQENHKRTEEISQLKSQNDSLNNELETLHEKLDRIIDNSNQHEEQLYSCFIQVLNEKKKYIHYLKQNIDEKQLQNVENTKTRKRRVEISDSDSDSYNTDEEKQKERKLLRKGDGMDLAPSTSTTKSTLNNNDAQNVFDVFAVTSDTDNEELFCTALPPRETQVIEVERYTPNKNTTATPTRDETTAPLQNNEETNASTSGSLDKTKENIDLPVDDTPVITYSTQDLLDNF